MKYFIFIMFLLFTISCFADDLNNLERIEQLKFDNKRIDELIIQRQNEIAKLTELKIENNGRIKELLRIEQGIEKNKLKEKEE